MKVPHLTPTVAGGAGAVVVALGGVLVLPHVLGGSSSEATAAVAPAARIATSTPTASATASDAPSTAAVAVAGARNPFVVPGRFLPAAAPVTTTSAAPARAASAAPVTASAAPVTTTSAAPTATSAPAQASLPAAPKARPTARPTPPPPVWVRLLSVSSDNSSAVVTVGTRRTTAHPGNAFVGGFRLLRLEAGRCGTIAYGTERFDMCAGSSVLVPSRPVG